MMRRSLRRDLAKDAAADPRLRGEEVLAVVGLESIAAVAEEDEVAVVEPLEELPRLVHFLGRHRQSVGVELRGVFDEFLAHRGPVMDGHAHLAEHLLEGGAQRLQLGGLRLLRDLDVHV